MRTSYKLFTLLLAGALLVVPGCDENGDVTEEPGALEGSWQLTDLTATYVRTAVAVPGTPADTTYSLTASWNLAGAVLGSASAADQELASFSVGDTVFATVAAFDAAALAASGISLKITFLEDNTYEFTGTYPTLLLDAEACSTYLAVPQVSDEGNYSIAYNAAETGGILAISPNDLLGKQVLPSFDDAVVAFSNAGATLQLDFLDRDGHDARITETGETWDEEEHRVTMGIPEAPIISALGIFATADLADTTGKSAYLYDPVKLATWGNYLTFYGLIIQGTIKTMIALDPSITNEAEALAAILALVAAGAADPTTTIPYATLLSDDSSGDFNPTALAAGGKLTYVINNVCIPVNEVIDFKSSWDKI